jgi:hypothetical protein
MSTPRPCGECDHARRFWGALRCVRDVRAEPGHITRVEISGSTLCEEERRHGRLRTLVFGGCGLAGRYWTQRLAARVESLTQRRLYLAVYDGFDGTWDARAFSDRVARDEWCSRLHDDLLYAPVDVEVTESVP